MNSYDKVWFITNPLLDKPEFKGLKQFLTIPTKVKFYESGVVLDEHRMVTPAFKIYNNDVRLGIIAENGPVHKLIKTLNMCNRNKYLANRGAFTIGEWLFYDMMSEGFEFDDVINNLSLSCDLHILNRSYITAIVRDGDDPYVSYRAYNFNEFLLAIWKYNSATFKDYILSEESKELFDLLHIEGCNEE